MTIKTKVNLIQSTTLDVGLATDVDGYLLFDNGTFTKPGFRTNSITSKLQYTNNGIDWIDFIAEGVNGDISGIISNSQVIAFNNYDLNTLQIPTDGQILYYNSSQSKWCYSQIGGDVSGVFTDISVDKLNGIELSSVAPVEGSTYLYDLATNKWIPGIVITNPDPAPTYTIGGDCSGIITNMKVIGFNTYPLETTQVPTNGEVFYYNSSASKWWCGQLSGDVYGSVDSITVHALNGIDVSYTAPTNGQTLVYSQFFNQWIPGTITSEIILSSLDILNVGGRLTLESNTPYMTDPAGYIGKSILYWTPIKGGKIALYDGANWNMFSPGQISVITAGLTGEKNYDIFMAVIASVPTLVFGTAWTNSSTRASELITQDGVYVQATTKYRYLGTVRSIGATYNTTFETISYDSLNNAHINMESGWLRGYSDVVYDSNNNRMYLIPTAYQFTEIKWHYIDCTTNIIHSYNNNLINTPVVSAYVGGAFDPVHNRIYLAPYSQADQSKWHYIDTNTNTVVAYDVPVLDSPSAGAYSGAAFDPYHNRIYFSPDYQSDKTKWHYIDTINNLVVSYNNTLTDKPLRHSYWGAAYASNNRRIYFAPYFQANQSKWHYIDTDSNTVVAYNNPIIDRPISEAYYGIAFDSVNNKMFFAPYYQATQAKWHYINTATDTVTTYTNNSGISVVENAYTGIAFDSTNNRMYFSPYAQSDEGNWHYVETNTDTVVYYDCNTIRTVENNVHIGAGFDPINHKIFFSSNSVVGTAWQYVSTIDNVVYDVNDPAAYLPVERSYNGGAFDSINNRIYFTPRLQAIQNSWHYIDCSTNSISSINNIVTNRAVGTYCGEAAFDPVHNRVYFAPASSQGNQAKWHYIDTTINTIVAYDNVCASQITSNVAEYSGAYAGAVFDSAHNRVYLVPLEQSLQAKWHYIDTNTGIVTAYDNTIISDISVYAYYNGVFDPIHNRIYLAPYGQINKTKWHYIDTNNNTIVSYDNIYSGTIMRYYDGATFNTTNNCVYFTEAYKAASYTRIRYYVDTNTNTITSYDSHSEADDYYTGDDGNGVFLPNCNRIYFASSALRAMRLDCWRYIDTSTNTMETYNAPSTFDIPMFHEVTDYAYFGAVYNSINKRIYFIPWYQAAQAKWHYIQLTETETSPVTFEYTASNLSLWNYYNRVNSSVKFEPTILSWRISSKISWTPFNNDTASCINILIGVKEDSVDIICKSVTYNADFNSFTVNDFIIVGIGVNSSSINSANLTGISNNSINASFQYSSSFISRYNNYISIGYNTIYFIVNFNYGDIYLSYIDIMGREYSSLSAKVLA